MTAARRPTVRQLEATLETLARVVEVETGLSGQQRDEIGRVRDLLWHLVHLLEHDGTEVGR